MPNRNQLRWSCSSVAMKGLQDIPDSWCVCESGIDENTPEDDLKCIQGFESRIQNINFCVLCALKWARFNFEESIDYTKF